MTETNHHAHKVAQSGSERVTGSQAVPVENHFSRKPLCGAPSVMWLVGPSRHAPASTGLHAMHDTMSVACLAGKTDAQGFLGSCGTGSWLRCSSVGGAEACSTKAMFPGVFFFG
eukprot:CAMPEP_0171074076 /NCGR_PEP_ID=MMETSP0766_2-20121228/11914_1 /TAXON_ID=439317 /ORGANISM="Gambierdiscus australes, Strain CAWD 149" /LENGTH=113 /DNA_ID=CAMNT_0011530831 /DNA_START=20 /DNA_END=361 /DNA_ORIENTATION=+